MNQSNVIAAYLFGAFFVFITARGELPKYAGFLLGSGATPTTPTPPVKIGFNMGDAIEVAKTAAMVLG